jgi:hypothetical protein
MCVVATVKITKIVEQKFAEKYKLQAQFLIVENQYKSAENSYQKMINYDDSATLCFCMCVVVVVKYPKIVKCPCHLR